MRKISGKKIILLLFTVFSILFTACNTLDTTQSSGITMQNIPEFSGEPYVVLNNNQPNFQESDFTTTSFETYSELDNLGRCGVAFANVGTDIMPTEERGSISQVKPSGWQSVKYDIVDGKIHVNIDKVVPIAKEMLAEIVRIQIDGDFDRAERYVLDNFVWTDNLELIAQKLQKINKSLNGRLETELADELSK